MNYCKPYFTKIYEVNQHAMISNFDTEVENVIRTHPNITLILKFDTDSCNFTRSRYNPVKLNWGIFQDK